MRASDRTLIGVTLFATCSAVSGTAMATDPQPPTAAASSPALSFPAFLDKTRLTDIEEAWSARIVRAGPTRVEAATREARQLEKAQATVSTARAAMKRAEQASEDAAAVRRRAEEISRRFAVGGVTTTPANATTISVETVATVQPTADAGAPAAPRVEHSAVVHAPPADADTGPKKPFGVGGPVPAEAAQSVQHAAIESGAPTLSPVPPHPHRAPRASSGKSPRSKAKVGTNPKPSNNAKPSVNSKSGSTAEVAANMRPPLAAANVLPPQPPASGDSPSADGNKSSTMSEVFSGFLRSFGWNSQPE